MNENEENNELVEEESVPETLETNEETEQVQTDASESEEQVQEENTEPEKKYTQEELDHLIDARFGREQRKYEKETEKYRELESIMKTALDANDLDDVIKKSREFYKNNGIDIPEYRPSVNQREEEILANAYAEEIISTGDLREVENEANRISQIPASKRTVRENVMFNKLCETLMENKNKEELKQKGIDVNILNEQKFKEFRKKLNYNTPITEAVEMYNKINNIPEVKKEKPYSVGSVKNNVKGNEIKEYYSPEDFDKLTAEDLDNPEIMKAVDRSRLQWYKNAQN